MRLPQKNSAYIHYVSFGDYVSGTTATEFPELSTQSATATDAVQESGRTWEDSRREVARLQGARDGRRRKLKRVVQEIRKALEGDALDGKSSPAYKAVFAEGAEYFVEANLGDLTTRYDDFATRLAALGDDHPVQSKLGARLNDERAAFDAANKVLHGARAARKRKKNALDQAIESWEKGQEQILGALIQKVGVRDADGFFPSRDTENDEVEEPTPTE